MTPHKFHDGDFWGGLVGFHRLRIVGGETDFVLGHAHEYDHLMELKRTEPHGATVELYVRLPDGTEVVQPWSDEEDTWYVKRGLVHHVKVPPGVVAHVRCWFALVDESGKRVVDPLRAASTEPEPWR
jgi:hypothetical protein